MQDPHFRNVEVIEDLKYLTLFFGNRSLPALSINFFKPPLTSSNFSSGVVKAVSRGSGYESHRISVMLDICEVCVSSTDFKLLTLKSTDVKTESQCEGDAAFCSELSTAYSVSKSRISESKLRDTVDSLSSFVSVKKKSKLQNLRVEAIRCGVMWYSHMCASAYSQQYVFSQQRIFLCRPYTSDYKMCMV